MLGKAFQYIRIIFPVFLLLNGSVAFAQASFEGLGDLASGLFSSSAWGVSGDGSVVVGDAISDSGTQAFRWQNDVTPPWATCLAETFLVLPGASRATARSWWAGASPHRAPRRHFSGKSM